MIVGCYYALLHVHTLNDSQSVQTSEVEVDYTAVLFVTMSLNTTTDFSALRGGTAVQT